MTATERDEWDVGAGGFLTDALASFKRTGRRTLRSQFALTVSLFQPLVWLFLFTQIFQSVTQIPGFTSESYVNFLTPSVIVMVALFSATVSGANTVIDIRLGILNKLLATPMNRTAIITGKTIAELTITTVQMLLVLGLALLLGARIETGILGVVGVLLTSLLFGIGFVAFNNTVALATRNFEATTSVTNFLTLPLLFLSSALIDPSLMPSWAQTLSALNPVTYGVTAARTIMLSGWQWNVLAPAISALVVFDLLLGSITIVMIRRTTELRS